MNKIITLFAILTIVSIIHTQTAQSTIDQHDKFPKYQEYISKFGKKFASLDDLTKNFQNYIRNTDNIDKLNSDNKKDEGEDNIFGETEFTDMDSEDFSKRYLTFTPPAMKLEDTDADQTSSENSANSNDVPTGRNLKAEEEHELRNLQSVPVSFDWRTKGVVGVVKNQGSCGDCWAFSATANIEGLYARKYGILRNFSEQQLLDCSLTNYGCNGGMMENAFSYIRSAGGFLQTADYGSYRAYRKTCSYNKSKAVAQVSSWVFPGSNEVTIKNYLYANGPISAALNANYLQNYRSGILNISYCSTGVNHAVTLVGYGSANGIDYWIVKNSWGATFGENGYFKIARGRGMCGINTYVVSAILA